MWSVWFSQEIRQGEGSGSDPAVQDRLGVMQRAVAQLEVDQRQLQKRNNQLEQRTERLRAERQHLRDTLTQVAVGQLK